MAAISLNASLRGLIERALLIAPTFADDLEVQILKDDMASECISVKSLRILRKALLEMKDESSLHSYIVGSKVTFPTLKPKTTQASEELVKRREFLVLRKEMKQYNMMIYGTEDNPNVQDILTTGNQFASLTNQLTISLNMIVAVFAMFGVGYYVGMQYSDNKTTQMTFGLVSAIGIMIVEMILFIRRATQMETAYEKKPTPLQEANAQMRSGALLSSQPTTGVESVLPPSSTLIKETSKAIVEENSNERYSVEEKVNVDTKKRN